MIHQKDKIYAYSKTGELLCIFDKDASGMSQEEAKNLIIGPRIKNSTNGESSLTFSILVASEKWQQIKHPETRYYVNGRWYTCLNENSYKYEGVGSVQKVSVTCCEEWYLLSTKYKQAYNASLLTYARATFTGWSGTNAVFRVDSSMCSNPGNTISPEMAWHQVRLWQPKDKKGNSLTYNVLKTKEYAPTNWEDAPASLAMSSINVSGNTATLYMTARASQEIQQHYDYQQGGTYQVDSIPYPPTIKEVWVNSTITTDTTTGNQTKRRIVTSNKQVSFSYNSSTGRFSVNYYPASNEEINYVIGVYDYYDMGELKSGATATFSLGAEVVDEHTFLILPKADTKYKLTIDGVEYEDSQVRDFRGVIMPRGSGGYAMWAALQGTGWQLGICDVIAKGFDPKIDYGVFNCESDMKDVLYVVQMVRELYGGILDWDSDKKILNYRAENSEDYDSYNDGFNDWTGYEFREGKNIKDQPEITVDNNLITKGYVLGYGNLNIKKVNGGKSYVTDYSYTTDIYEGYLEQPLIYDTNDEGGQRQLLYWGQKEIKKKSRPRKTIKYNCIDIRTVEGYEHETFQINDVCRAYYRDTETGEEKYELKRIISWDYNPFAYLDSTVELGDKTENEVELFKLIYNSAVENAPKTNASGKISSDEIVVEIDISELGFEDIDIGDYEYPNYPIGNYTNGYGGSINNNLTDYISLIARKTTQNTDAISGLIIEANELYAQSELFSTYQKRTDDLISETYSGLKVYADGEISKLDAVVKGNYQTLNNDIQQLTVQTNAGFQAQQTQNQAFARQFASYDQTLIDHQRQITQNTQSVAQCVTIADANHSYAALTADYTRQINSISGQVQQVVQSQAKFEAEANANFAKTSQLSKYATTDYVNGELKKKTTMAEVQTYATNNFASASMVSTLQNGLNSVTSSVVANTDVSYLKSIQGTKSSASVAASRNGLVQITASVGIGLFAPQVSITGTFNLSNYNVSWKSATIAGTTINYLGR